MIRRHENMTPITMVQEFIQSQCTDTIASNVTSGGVFSVPEALPPPQT